MNKRFILLAILLCWSVLLFSQDSKFVASVNKNTVGTGEQFEVTFSAEGNASQYSPPNFNGFQVLSGPNESNSITSINGNTTVSVSVSYILMAVKEGDFTIGSASMIVNGHKLITNPIKIKVVKGQPLRQNSQSQSQSEEGVIEAKGADLSKLLFLKAEVNKQNVYQGQQITLRYRVYTRVDIIQSQVDKIPDINGFWSQEIKSSQQQAQFHIETYKGVRYNVADVKQAILFPEHSGNITLEPFSITFLVKQPMPAKDIMDQFFGAYREVKYQAKSLPVVIHVKQLPENGKPSSFTGAVGSFKVSTSVDKTSLKANEALNYKVKVTGTGNIKLLKDLSTSFPEDFEKYDPKITDSVNETESGVSGTRTYNYLLIPRHKGDYTINPLKFSYFNPETNKYISLSTKAFQIHVEKGNSENNVTALVGDNKQDVRVLDKDIRYIKNDTNNLSNPNDLFYDSFLYYLLLLSGPLSFVGIYAYRRWYLINNSDIVKVKNRQAGKVAAKHLQNAQKQLMTNNTKGFYEDLFKGLYGYLSDKLNILYAELNRDTLTTTLNKKAVSNELINKLLETLDLCEMARYAPVSHITEQEVFEKAKGIINDLENEIK